MGSSTEPPTSPPLKPTSSRQVRNKFLSVIGIDDATKHAATPPKPQLNKNWIHPRQQRTAKFEESLKYNPEEDAIYSPKRKKMDSKEMMTPEKKRSITFSDTVKVLPIPMRDEYSNRVRSRLWSNAVEIHQNATRNAIEFAAEG